MTDRITLQEVYDLLNQTTMDPETWDRFAQYAAQQGKRDEKDAVRAQTLEEFRVTCMKKWVEIWRAKLPWTQAGQVALDYVIDNIPQKPSDVERLAAAVTVSNRVSSRRDRPFLFASGEVGLMKWDGMAGKFVVPDRGMSVDDMIAHLEKPKPVTWKQAKEIVDDLDTVGASSNVVEQVAAIKRYFDQEEGESDA